MKDAKAQADVRNSAVVSDSWTALSPPLWRSLGKRTAQQLEKIGLETVADLIYHFPFRYATRGQLLPIRALRDGEAVTVIARVLDTNLRPMNARRGFILNVRISDGEQILELTFFGKSARPLKYHESRLLPGTVAIFSGTVSSYRGQLQLTHPDYELTDGYVDPERITRPIPIYHASVKMPSWKIQRAVATVLPSLSAGDLLDPLPPAYRAAHGLPELYAAIHQLHEPANAGEWARARERMKHEEAFVLQAALAQRAARMHRQETRRYPKISGGILDAFDARLPFTLTAGQRQVGEEIARDLAAPSPMQRLLEGDVGSGKTIVALRAMLQVIDGGGQAALLAPTEVLAQQHLRSIQSLLGDLDAGGQLGAPEHATRVELLTGSMTAGERRKALARLASGQAGIVVGTHALLSDDVQLPFLGLAVVDEQHRFGVDQRERLARGIHTLVMTATPIPRTLAMTIFGDLEISTLRESPGGRAGISTTLVPSQNGPWMARAWQRAREEIDAGGRVYVVCPRIGDEAEGPAPSAEQSTAPSPADGEASELASVEETAERLAALPQLAGVQIGTLHGRMGADEKLERMREFASGAAPLLVATTVIEVGVDVPEATMMIILDADRFGLSQLHQLRGRIGRGTKPGVCLAVSDAPAGSLAARRLEAFASTTDGFALAEKDMELRDEGDVLGSQQAGGHSHLRFLSVVRDSDIATQARLGAQAVIAADPALSEHGALAQAIARLDTERAEYLERG